MNGAVEETKTLPRAEKLARLEQHRTRQKERELAAEDARLDAELERYELADKFERELGGPEGQAFAILDATKIGESFFVVKAGPAILWKTYWDSKMTDVDKCDLVRECIVHPTKERYLETRSRKPAIDIPLVTLLGRLYGLIASGDEKK